ncbi:hypothetical protein BBK14_33905 [Parafrankia soli]|uniref:Uncharacterized protein n=1 Tax=Parafrankia soli TaxID=2599596 RepID=A0A1S1QCR7_9ACTN|nr:hypothetical protein [Parafrankia soli]OHV31437.1 hypothetical protein BBK14_33905 [Parafrankia soli]
MRDYTVDLQRETHSTRVQATRWTGQAHDPQHARDLAQVAALAWAPVDEPVVEVGEPVVVGVEAVG